jgi:hypothetical protein
MDKELLKKAFEAGETYSSNIEFAEYAETFEGWYENNLVKNHIDLTNVMVMLPPVTFLEKVNRVEVIDQKGRSYVNWKPTNKTEFSLQDDGKTLKVFISN